jgi:hypothetical protein
MGIVDQRVRVGEAAEPRIDVTVVGHVVAGVGLGRRVERIEPDRVDAEVAQVRQAGPDAGQVADPVAVGIGEATHVDLVDHRVAPPGTVGGRLGRSGGAHLATRSGVGPPPSERSWRGRGRRLCIGETSRGGQLVAFLGEL